MNMIETMHLTKEYSDLPHPILSAHKKGICIWVPGPNGAGKSTTMKMFLGLTAHLQVPLP